jgi:uncharacterized protein with PhoU and TrkA domain
VHPENVSRLEALSALRFADVPPHIGTSWASLIPVRALVCGHEVAGASLKELRLRSDFDVHCIALQRGDDVRSHRLASEVLQSGDQLILVGYDEKSLDSVRDKLSLVTGKLDAHVQEYFERTNCTVFRSQEQDGPLSLESLAFGELFGVQAFALLNDQGQPEFLARNNHEIQSQRPLLALVDEDIRRILANLGELRIEAATESDLANEQEERLIEAVIAPRSSLVGKTLRDLEFRQRYGLQVVSLWRAGRPVTGRLSQDPLTFGDALLLQGTEDARQRLQGDPDFLVLEEAPLLRMRRDKAVFSIAGFLIMVVIAAFGLQPAHIAALSGALVAVGGGAIRLDEAYRDIEWKIVVLIASLIPLGLVVERSGFVPVFANVLIAQLGNFGTLSFIVALVLLASVVSQALDNSVAFIMLAPLAVQVAPDFGLDARSAVLCLATATSLAFLTPFSHKAYLLVMSAGGYRNADYFKLGLVVSTGTFFALVVSAAIFL